MVCTWDYGVRCVGDALEDAHQAADMRGRQCQSRWGLRAPRRVCQPRRPTLDHLGRVSGGLVRSARASS
eukprot:2519824-Pyramimonas_sp.AAC.1